MKTIFYRLAVILLGAIICIGSSACHDVERDESATENTITSMTLSVRVPQDDGAIVYKNFAAVIDQEAGTITFKVPAKMSTTIDEPTDLTNVLLSAVIPVGAIIEPGLSGPQDLTEGLDITVRAANGDVRFYTISVIIQ